MTAELTPADTHMVESLRMLAHQRALRNASKLRSRAFDLLWQGYVERLGELLDELRQGDTG